MTPSAEPPNARNPRIARRALVGLGAVGAALRIVPACGDLPEPPRTCTSIGCEDRLAIELARGPETDPSPRALPAGRYEVELAHDDVAITCRHSWPAETNIAFDCPASDHTVLFVLDEDRVTPLGIDVVIEDQSPPSLEVVVRLDGAVITAQTFTPIYEEYFPNGPECDLVPCRQALVTGERVVLPASP